jgi:small GTP-binding protein
MNQDQPVAPPAKFKLVFLGDQSVGKTSIINRFIYGTFEAKDHPTVGIDFTSKTLQFDNKTIRLQLWDTAGQERFRSLIPSYIRDSSVAIIVYDVTNRNSFTNLRRWIDDVRNERGNEVLLVIVGNKTDLEERAVQFEEGAKLAKENDALFSEVSARNGTGIQELFTNLAGTLPGNDTSVQAPSGNQGGAGTNQKGNVVLENPTQGDEEIGKKKGGCC